MGQFPHDRRREAAADNPQHNPLQDSRAPPSLHEISLPTFQSLRASHHPHCPQCTMAPRIPQADWDLHRSEIASLYIEHNKSLKDIMSYMAETYNFQPTKNQYETKLKEWRLRKNLTGPEWGVVDYKIKKRKADDQGSAIFLEGFRIPQKRVKKELVRRFPPRLGELPWQRTVPSPETPFGILIQTPKTPGTVPQTPHTPVRVGSNHISPAGSIPGTPGAALSPEYPGNYLRLDNLPWLQFRLQLQRQDSLSQDWVTQLFNTNSELRQRSASPHVHTVEPGSSSASGSVAKSSEGTAAPTTSFLLSGLVPSLKRESAEFVPAVHSRLQAISVEVFEGEQLSSIETLLGPFNNHFLLEFLKYAAYLASNNMLNLQQYDKIFDVIVENTNSSTLTTLFSVALHLPTIEAFARCIFESALQCRNEIVVQILLKAGLDPNPPLRQNGKTPLQVAVESRNLTFVQDLLKAGADINADLVAIIEMLLDEGADPNVAGRVHCSSTALQAAAECGDIDVVNFLLQAGAEVNAPAASSQKNSNRSVGCTPLQLWAAIGIPPSWAATKLLQRLVDAGADINAPPYWNPDSLSVSIPDHIYYPLSYAKVQRMYGKTALQGAVFSGELEVVQALLDAGADVNAPLAWGPAGGKTALQEAARKDIELVHLLLSSGANVNAPAAENRLNGRTALQAAAEAGKVETVQLLLELGANVNAPGYPALSLAISSPVSLQLVPILLYAGAEVNPEFEGFSPLASAIMSKHYEQFLPALLQSRANVNHPGCSPLVLAVNQKHYMQLLPILLNAGADVNAEHKIFSDEDFSFTGVRTYPLIEATMCGRVPALELLLAWGADINAKYTHTALEIAISDGNKEAIAVLLNGGADPNISSDYTCMGTALSAAVGRNDLPLVENLLSRGVKVNQVFPNDTQPETPWVSNALPLAVQNGNTEMVELLLEAGADINGSAVYIESDDDVDASRKDTLEEDSLGTTALLTAVRYGWDELADLLLNAGANINARPQPFGGWTALQAAAKRGDKELVQTLLNAGAQVNDPAHTDRGRTALQAACFAGSIDVVRLLLKAGAEINAPAAESRGVTALQAVAMQGHVGIAILLLEAGADPNAPPAKFHGRTALEAAAEHGRLDMLQLLLNAKADIGGRIPERARELALENGHAVVAKVLEKFC
ncbi:ankyrin repeat-containing domain protein [Sphaerosporella brunnea]|uniref:Ankyrin repeat-containing domain protein n=1 Tax=Sphaerosporella brunnea TaxID=1250544 RepID=A0A5J5EYE4_9PEZI|nr:ankyrin repeat-containing domain protein [Sphaerosporella brunnea]